MADKHEDAMNSVAGAAELFSTDFHKKIASKVKGNFVGSALSAYTVLAMTAYGANGTTAEAMRKCLHLPDDDDHAHKGFQRFIDTINYVQYAVLKVANKIYASADTSVKDKFKEITGTYFRSESDTLNFIQNVESAKVINAWCFKKTNGKITEIVSADDLDYNTTMVLLNAVYFKANWKDKFDAKMTKPEPFHVDKFTKVDVPMMHRKKDYFFRELNEVNAKCIALPYLNEDLYMVIIVPNEIDGLADVEKNLDKIELEHKNFKFARREIVLSLPKFKVESTHYLNDHLSELGMAEIFTDKANFNNICDRPLKVSKVLQKAFIEVNEEGSEASAVFGFQMMLNSTMPPTPLYLSVDRPFIYKIVHKDTTLFSGHVVNPLLT